MRLRDAAGRRVVARDTAERVGRVKRYLVDPAGPRIAAIQVAGGPKDRPILPWEKVAGFGGDAVIVPSADVLREPLDPREDAFLDGAFDLAGKRVLTAEGDEVGTVDEVDFDDRSGRLERILLAGGGALTIAAVVAVGPYAVILPA